MVLNSYEVEVRGSYAYLAGYDGFAIIDIGDPRDPSMAGGLGGVGWTLSVAANASLIVTPGSGTYLRIFDVKQPGDPVQVGVAETQGRFWDLAIVGDFVYTANSSSARIIDVSDPTAPVDVGSMGRAAIGFAVSGNHLSSVSDYHGLTVMDIGNPGSPSLRGTVTLPGSARRVAVTNGHAYVPVHDHGLQIVDGFETGDTNAWATATTE